MSQDPQYKPPTIEAMPQKALPWQILDTISGGVTDPDAWRFDSREENFMRLASILAAFLAANAGAIQNVSGAVTPQAFGKQLKADPFGFEKGPIDRRVFLDRLAGRHTQRGQDAQKQAWDAWDEWQATGNRGSANDALFNKAADTSEMFNKQLGWPNPVVNPEKIGRVTWSPPGAKHDPATYFLEDGPVANLYNALKAELLKRTP